MQPPTWHPPPPAPLPPLPLPPPHCHSYAINDAKLKALGWTPERVWDEGIEETIAWYRALPEDYWPEWQSALAPHPMKHS